MSDRLQAEIDGSDQVLAGCADMDQQAIRLSCFPIEALAEISDEIICILTLIHIIGLMKKKILSAFAMTLLFVLN